VDRKSSAPPGVGDSSSKPGNMSKPFFFVCAVFVVIVVVVVVVVLVRLESFTVFRLSGVGAVVREGSMADEESLSSLPLGAIVVGMEVVEGEAEALS